jgi:hypothetical protein
MTAICVFPSKKKKFNQLPPIPASVAIFVKTPSESSRATIGGFFFSVKAFKLVYFTLQR